jgi:predicted transporter
VSRRLRLATSAVTAAIVLLLAPAAALAAGNDVGRNIGSLLRQFAGELYGGFLAIVGLYFLINRKYTELGLYLVAAIVVGWLVFNPDQVAGAARAIGQRVLP